VGHYEGSAWVSDDGRRFLRLHQQISADLAAERLATRTPLILEEDASLVSGAFAQSIIANVCSEQDNQRNRRRARRSQFTKPCWVIELWQAPNGEETMMALESGPRDAELRYDPHGKGHSKDDPMYLGGE